MRTIATSKPIRGRSIERKPTGFLCQTHINSQVTTPGIAAPMRHPAGFACHARMTEPRENHASAVVIPQEGQSRPVSTEKAQGPSPS